MDQIFKALNDPTRRALLDHPDYWHYRAEVLGFLEEYEHGATKKEAA